MAENNQEVSREELLRRAMETLENYCLQMASRAGKDEAYATNLWKGISSNSGLLQELAYYHDYGKFLCRYKVCGYTLADILVWQVDHFKLYMDRPDDMNRYRTDRLLLEAFETMIDMEQNPEPYINKMIAETGQDRDDL